MSCSETNRLPDTSPAKMSLFKMSKELHFRICNYGKPRASRDNTKAEMNLEKETLDTQASKHTHSRVSRKLLCILQAKEEVRVL